jgi:DNA adenine methylase
MAGPIPYIGGKSRLAPRLIRLFPKHTTYVEPFCGAAHVFFTKPPSPSEVLNDLDGELLNFLRVCQLHHPELIRFLAFSVHSRVWRNLHLRQEPATLTDIQRAARFLYLQRTAWGAAVDGQVYGAFVTGAGRFRAAQFESALEAAAHRLEHVQLEQLPYQAVLEKYDRPTTLFYLDPPYVNLPLYRFNFTREDFQTLAGHLRQLKGRFLLSINDHPVAIKAFGEFVATKVPVSYSVVPQGRKRHELLFSNFTLDPDSCGSTISPRTSSTV